MDRPPSPTLDLTLHGLPHPSRLLWSLGAASGGGVGDYGVGSGGVCEVSAGHPQWRGDLVARGLLFAAGGGELGAQFGGFSATVGLWMAGAVVATGGGKHGRAQLATPGVGSVHLQQSGIPSPDPGAAGVPGRSGD